MNKLLGLFRPAQNSHSGACCGTPISVDSAEPEIVGWMVSEFQKTEHVDLRKDEIAMKRLVEAAQKAKSDLSSAQETTISLPFIGADATGPKHLNLKLTRAKLSELNGYRT